MEEKRVANYHTHTARCGHASGADEDYVRAAIEAGWRVLGFSDHVPWPYESGFANPGVRMRVAELEGYLASLRRLREKYQDRIRIYIGFECEYFPAYLDWLREMKERQGLDYLILGNHHELSDETGMYYGSATRPEELLRYCENTILGMETGLFAYLAHPDLAFMSYPAFDDTAREVSRRLCRRARELGVPLEYNLQGQRLQERGAAPGLGYPCRAFWEVAAQEGNTAVIGMDAHEPDALIDYARYDRAAAELKALGLPRLSSLPGLA
ncbi:MAG: histidinol-phosphatase [Oscillospiraceae bacterium]